MFRLLPRRLHATSLRYLVLGAATVAGGGTLAIQYINDGAESAAREKEEAMKARFEDWAKEHDRRYPNEEEKAKRFRAFKASAEFMDSHNLVVHKRASPTEMSCFADWTREERWRMRKAGAGVDGESEYDRKMRARLEKGFMALYPVLDVKLDRTLITR